MLKLLLVLGFISSPTISYGKDPLVGNLFSTCDISKHYHMEYFSEFGPKNEEFEVELYKRASTKGCKGQDLFAVGRIWHYELNENELITTLKYVNVVLMESEFVDFFNKMKFCDHSNWKVDEQVPCAGKNIFYEEMNEGLRTIHKFKLMGNNLEVQDQDGEKTILKKTKAH